MPTPKIDIAKFLSDPEFQADRELMNGVIDARLKHHADEAIKNKPPEELNIFDRLFGAKK